MARLGGDEFILLLPGLNCVENAKTVARKILAAFQEPYQIGSLELNIHASIGVSCAPSNSDEAGELIKMADNAMYQSKKSGRNGCRFYQS